MSSASASLGLDRIRHRAADALAILHVLIVGFFALGWTLPWPWSWWAVIAGGLGLQLVWLFFNNVCPLTLIEDYLRGKQAAGDTDDSPPRHFVASLISRWARRPVSPFVGDLIVYGVLYASMAAATWRLWG